MRGGLRFLAGLAAGLLALPLPATAHPHILIDAAVTIVFDGDEISGLRHYWTFDAPFSAWMVQGLDTDGDGVTAPEEMQGLADENMVGLAEYGFYTTAGDVAAPMQFTPVGDQRMSLEDGRVVLSFSLASTEPQPVGSGFSLGVYDPEYYVAIGFADEGDVRLEGAPDACAAELIPPRPMDAATEERLYSLGPEVLELPPDLAAAMRGTQGEIVVRCGGVEAPPPSTAAEAAAEVAAARPSLPFGGPPPEPGLDLPRTGVFGWIDQQQRSFYALLTGALDRLRSDWTAFWVLGGLSFLYGVFHAAGPGHGKVVISSYMLANETQLRRGIALSMASALVQSGVAIAFAVVAAGVLGLTRLALNDAAHWIGVVSYALVTLLGLWLIARRLFGWWHAHSHRGSMAAKAHRHLHEGEHHHAHAHDHHGGHGHHHDHHDHMPVVPPAATAGSWREQLGVVLAVGLRPCSGALVVLVFALSQGLLPAGIAAVVLMGVGTGLTVAVLATVAVTAKGLATRLGGGDSAVANSMLWWMELAGAVLVTAFGLTLLLASL